MHEPRAAEFQRHVHLCEQCAYELGLPNTYRQRVGTGLGRLLAVAGRLYVQDDWTISKTFSLSLGLRHEFQSHLDDKTAFAPRVGFTWTPGKYTVRGGWGIFNDWYQTSLYEQTLRVNGITQQDLVIQSPGYPDPFAGAFATVLPPSIIRESESLAMPWMHQASIGVERTFGALRVQTNYFMQRGYDQFRSVNVNAPVAGLASDPHGREHHAAGVDGRKRHRPVDGERELTPGPSGGSSWAGTTCSRASTTSSIRRYSLPANNYDPAAEWGPASQDVRHRMFSFLTFPLPMMKLRGSLMTQAQSASPYTDHHRSRQQQGHRRERPAGRRGPQQRPRIRDVEHERAREPRLQLRAAAPDRRRSWRRRTHPHPRRRPRWSRRRRRRRSDDDDDGSGSRAVQRGVLRRRR